MVEQIVGEIKSRFRCLHTSGGALQYAPKKCAKIVIACLLHNYCIDRRLQLHDDMLGNEDPPPEEFAAPRNETQNSGAAAVRRQLIECLF